jgi:adenylate cyclase class 2
MPQLEIEVKYRVASHDGFSHQFSLMGAIPLEAREDADHYFNAPDRDFAQTDEAFRVRRIGEQNFLTYKGPKRDTLTKTREEIEIPFEPGENSADELVKLLQRLGYRSVTVVRKRRQLFELKRGRFTVQFSLDELPEVGQFVEIEIVADESDFEAARDLVLELAQELNLSQVERRSYLGLLLDHHAGKS